MTNYAELKVLFMSYISIGVWPLKYTPLQTNAIGLAICFVGVVGSNVLKLYGKINLQMAYLWLWRKWLNLNISLISDEKVAKLGWTYLQST